MVQAIITISNSDADGVKYNQCLCHSTHSISTVLHVDFLSLEFRERCGSGNGMGRKVLSESKLTKSCNKYCTMEPHHNSQEQNRKNADYYYKTILSWQSPLSDFEPGLSSSFL